jgi:hypothetical protein
VLLGVLKILFVGDVGTEVATTNVRIFLIDSFATISPDASPATC